MKKFLAMFGAVSLTALTSTSVIACSDNSTKLSSKATDALAFRMDHAVEDLNKVDSELSYDLFWLKGEWQGNPKAEEHNERFWEAGFYNVIRDFGFWHNFTEEEIATVVGDIQTHLQKNGNLVLVGQKEGKKEQEVLNTFVNDEEHKIGSDLLDKLYADAVKEALKDGAKIENFSLAIDIKGFGFSTFEFIK